MPDFGCDEREASARLPALARGTTTPATPEKCGPQSGSGSSRLVHTLPRDIGGDAWTSFRSTAQRVRAAWSGAGNYVRTPAATPPAPTLTGSRLPSGWNDPSCFRSLTRE